MELFSKPFPLALAAANVWVTPITIHAATTNGILFEVKDFRVRHPVKDLAQGTYLPALRTGQELDGSPTSLSSHEMNIDEGTDKESCCHTSDVP